jgi:hypothetical protein
MKSYVCTSCQDGVPALQRKPASYMRPNDSYKHYLIAFKLRRKSEIPLTNSCYNQQIAYLLVLIHAILVAEHSQMLQWHARLWTHCHVIPGL